MRPHLLSPQQQRTYVAALEKKDEDITIAEKTVDSRSTLSLICASPPSPFVSFKTRHYVGARRFSVSLVTRRNVWWIFLGIFVSFFILWSAHRTMRLRNFLAVRTDSQIAHLEQKLIKSYPQMAVSDKRTLDPHNNQRTLARVWNLQAKNEGSTSEQKWLNGAQTAALRGRSNDDTGLLSSSAPSVLIVTIAKDSTSWGPSRSFLDYLQLIRDIDYPNAKVSLGLLVSDDDEFARIMWQILSMFEQELDSEGQKSNREGSRSSDGSESESPSRKLFTSVTLMQFSDPAEQSISYETRHDNDIQRKRRRMLSRLRNRALFTSLREEDYVLWIDADILTFPPYLLRYMISSNKDIIQPWTITPGGGTYDENEWVGPRATPNAEERQSLSKGGIFVPRRAEGSKNMGDLAREMESKGSSETFVEVDSVGATALLVKADIHRQGAVFSPISIIGSEWDYEGYDGIESEGLCYVAKALGYRCWGMVKDVIVHP